MDTKWELVFINNHLVLAQGFAKGLADVKRLRSCLQFLIVYVM
jgi:hypothetical protein